MKVVPVCAAIAVVAAFATADSARAEEIQQPAPNPKWHRCKGKWAPDAPGLGKRIALTFDDGPSVKLTPTVLKVLRRHKIPATFFVVTRRVRGRGRDLVREIEADPLFEIGNHTHSHPRLTEIPRAQVVREIDRATKILERAGVSPRYFRFPYSLSNCAMTRMVEKRGMIVTGWHVDSADWCYAAGGGHCRRSMWKELPDRYRRNMIDLIVARAKQNDGGIVLLHDIHRYTVKRLEAIIRALEREGFTFVKLDDRAFPLLNGYPPGT